MGHRPTETGPPAHDLLAPDPEQGTPTMPSDIYTHPHYYTGFRHLLPETMQTLQAARGNPNAMVTIHRAQRTGTGLNHGDWVTLSRPYAEQDLASAPEHDLGGREVRTYQVPASTVRYAGDDLMEWGYFGPPIGPRKTAATSLDDWRPTRGMFSPGEATLDPRVFDGERMRPEIRTSVLGALDAFWTPRYGDWQVWAKPYLAGSGASYWWDSDKDMDILVGVDLERLREVRPQNEGVPDDDIVAHLDAELKNDLDPLTVNLNGFETTFFVNAGSYDIRDIKPYAAYDLLADAWVVLPPRLPADWGPRYFPDDVWRQCAQVGREAATVLALTDPAARHQACVALFDRLHSWRHLAYTEHGKGWLDTGNVVWQYLSQRPDRLLARLYAEKHDPSFDTSPELVEAVRRTASDGLAAAVAEFAEDWGPGLAEPQMARDMCERISKKFLRTLEQHGVHGELVSGVRYGDFMGQRVVEQGHFAVRVGDEVYDWTIRQFDPRAKVPTVTSYADWRGRWESLGKAAGANGEPPEGLTYQTISRRDDQGRLRLRGVSLVLNNESVGHLLWDAHTGEVDDLVVHQDHRRRGLATMLWNKAREIDPKVKHSNSLTPDGFAWRHHLGGARGDLPGDIEYGYIDRDPLPNVMVARHGGKTIGSLSWRHWNSPPEIALAWVHPDYQRRGIATELLRRARERVPNLTHSGDRTDAAEAWSNTTGAPREDRYTQGDNDAHEQGARNAEQIDKRLADGHWRLQKQAGPVRDRIIPAMRRAVSPGELRKPRPVALDRGAEDDLKKLPGDVRNALVRAVQALEDGKADLEAKARSLAGAYSLRLSNAWRALFYRGPDFFWHCFAVTDHDYDEVQRRFAAVLDHDPSYGESLADERAQDAQRAAFDREVNCPNPQHYDGDGLNPLVWDEANGYQHSDGSCGHEDGSVVSDWVRPAAKTASVPVDWREQRTGKQVRNMEPGEVVPAPRTYSGEDETITDVVPGSKWVKVETDEGQAPYAFTPKTVLASVQFMNRPVQIAEFDVSRATTTRCVVAFVDAGPAILPLGFLTWDRNRKTIELAYVSPQMRRKRVASRLLDVAESIDGPLRLTSNRSPDGTAWSRSTGRDVPKNTKPLRQNEADGMGGRMMGFLHGLSVDDIVGQQHTAAASGALPPGYEMEIHEQTKWGSTPYTTVLVKHQGKPIAGLGVYKSRHPHPHNPGEALYVDKIEVYREHQRKGIATAMYDEIHRRFPGMAIQHANGPAQSSDARALNDTLREKYGPQMHLGVNAAGEMPPKPGTAPIPPGHVRLWHYTHPEHVESIRQHGLDATKARGDSGQGWGNEASAGIWASTKPPSHGDLGGKPFVEFHASLDDISDSAESPWREKAGIDPPGSFQQGYHHVIMKGSVPPEQIVGIHEPWHTHYHYINDDPHTKADVLSGMHDSLLDDPGYGPAIEKIKREGSINVLGYAFTPGPHHDPAPPWEHVYTGRGRVNGAGTPEDPIDAQGNIDHAVTLIARGKHVRLNHPAEVSAVTKHIAELAEHARRRGATLPTLNLGHLSVPGTNVFMHDTKGIPRDEMPQLTGVPEPGSPAAAKAGPDGRVNLANDFVEALKQRGVSVTDTERPTHRLRATQNELNGEAVSGIANAIRAGKQLKPIFTTRDGYILDGHHTWAGSVAVDADDGKFGDVKVPVREIGMNIGDALDFTRAWTKEQGIEPRGSHTVHPPREMVAALIVAGALQHPSMLRTVATDTETYWHVTDNPKFALDPTHAPAGGPTELGDDGYRHQPGLFVTHNPELWRMLWRPMGPAHGVEVEVPAGVAKRLGHDGDDRDQWHIKPQDYDKVHIKRVVPIHQAIKEAKAQGRGFALVAPDERPGHGHHVIDHDQGWGSTQTYCGEYADTSNPDATRWTTVQHLTTGPLSRHVCADCVKKVKRRYRVVKPKTASATAYYVGLSMTNSDRLHAITDNTGSAPRRALCGASVDPDQRTFDPQHPRACPQCVKRVTKTASIPAQRAGEVQIREDDASPLPYPKYRVNKRLSIIDGDDHHPDADIEQARAKQQAKYQEWRATHPRVRTPDRYKPENAANWVKSGFNYFTKENSAPGTAAFVDLEHSPQHKQVEIAYMAVRPDQRRKGHARRLIEEIYRRYPGHTIHWGQMMQPEIGHLYDDMKAQHPEQTGSGSRWF